jgi:hypothetical protein
MLILNICLAQPRQLFLQQRFSRTVLSAVDKGHFIFSIPLPLVACSENHRCVITICHGKLGGHDCNYQFPAAIAPQTPCAETESDKGTFMVYSNSFAVSLLKKIHSCCCSTAISQQLTLYA